jgi:hypothetical protein
MTRKDDPVSYSQTETFLPDLERQLTVAAAERVSRRSRSALLSPYRGEKAHNGTRRRVARVAFAAAAVFAIGGSALAATGVWNGGWNPLIGDRASSGAPTHAATAVPEAVREALGVMGRSPTPADRGAAVRETLHGVDAYHVAGVRPNSVRYLGPAAAGSAAILISVEAADSPGGGSLCIFRPIVSGGRGAPATCFDLPQILAGEAVASVGSPQTTLTYGLVPDGVATVVAHFADGTEREVPVANNFFQFAEGSVGEEEVGCGGNVCRGEGENPRGQSYPLEGSEMERLVWQDDRGKVVQAGPR